MACELSSGGGRGTFFYILTPPRELSASARGARSPWRPLYCTPRQPTPASPVCPALSCHQVGQGKRAVCMGGENGAVHHMTCWDSSARSRRGSVAPSPNTPLQCPALRPHPKRVSPGSVYWTVAWAQRDLGGKVHSYHFPNLSEEVTCMKELICPGCLLRTLPDRESSGMSSI